MNLQFTHPFAQNYPDIVDTSLDASAQCVKFNHGGSSRFPGSYLACGRTDGCVAIYDFETRGYLRLLEGHVKAVTTLSWSRNSRYLLSASRDWNVIIWDLLTGDRRETIRFDAPVTSAMFHPRNSKLLVVTLQNKSEAVFVDLRHDENGGRWELDSTNRRQTVGEDGEQLEAEERTTSKRRRENATIARFNPRGDLVYVGTSQGNLHVFESRSKLLIRTESISKGSSISNMEFDKTGHSLVTNSNDRCLRVYSVDDLAQHQQSPQKQPTPPDEQQETDMDGAEANGEQDSTFLTLEHRFQDLVNRTPWNTCNFSNDGDFVVGGAGHNAGHQIYVWDRANGSLAKILEGPKDPLEDLHWHPVRPAIASASDQGLIHIWVTRVPQNWSAYAAGFEELEENIEYQEREDEFDIEDESEIERRKADKEDVRVDISFIDSGDGDAKLLQKSTSGISAAGSPATLLTPVGTDVIGQPRLAEYLTSSANWADIEPDDDSREDFAPPLDLDLEEGDVMR